MLAKKCIVTWPSCDQDKTKISWSKLWSWVRMVLAVADDTSRVNTSTCLSHIQTLSARGRTTLQLHIFCPAFIVSLKQVIQSVQDLISIWAAPLLYIAIPPHVTFVKTKSHQGIRPNTNQVLPFNTALCQIEFCLICHSCTIPTDLVSSFLWCSCHMSTLSVVWRQVASISTGQVPFFAF